jgi:hypothetical protein
MTIDELTAAIEAGFAADRFDTDVLVGTDSILEARLNKGLATCPGSKTAIPPRIPSSSFQLMRNGWA